MALTHAMAGAGGLAAALSGIMRRRQPRLAAAAPTVLRRCCYVRERERRPAAASARPGHRFQPPRPPCRSHPVLGRAGQPLAAPTAAHGGQKRADVNAT